MLELAGSDWKWLEIAKHCSKKYGLKWLKMGNDGK